MIEHTTHIMYNIVLINFMIHWKNGKSDSIEIGYGQMGVWVKSNFHDHSISYDVFIKKSNITYCWIFFETSHGKGEHDGAGACVKRALQRH